MARKVVKKVVRKATKKIATKASYKKKEISADFELPTQKKKASDDFFSYIHCFYGRAGIGKSTLASSFPETLMLSCERVSKGLQCFDFNSENGGVYDWDVFRAAVDLLQKSDEFKTVAIDTIEAAYEQCQTWVCAKGGYKHPNEANDYGKTWKACIEEFHSQMFAIYNSGRGLVLLSHSKEADITAHSGEKYVRIQPSLGGKVLEWLKQKTDFMTYCEFVKDIHGDSKRVFITNGDEIVDAKNPVDLPFYLPFEKGSKGVEILLQAFNGEDVGLPVSDLRPSKETSKAVTQMVRKQNVQEIKKGGSRKRKVK